MSTVNLEILALLVNSETRDNIQKVLSQIEHVSFAMEHVGNERPLLRFADPHADIPDIIILEINGHSEDDIFDIEQLIRKQSDKLSVFVTYKEGNMEIMRRLMHAGVREAFPFPIQTNDLLLSITEELSKKRARSHEEEKQHSVISFINAKGGSGCTTMVVNTAYELVTRHKCKVIVVDLDIQFGAVARYLDLNPDESVLSALLHYQRIDQVYLKALISHHPSGLDVLAAPREIVPMSAVHEEAVSHLVDALSENYDIIILDIPRSFLPWTVAALKLSDPIYLVLQNILSVIIDAKYLLDQLPQMGITTSELQLINNRAKSDIKSISIDKLKETVGRTRVHRVRNDFETALRSQDLGVPVCEVKKHSIMAKDIHNLTDSVYNAHMGIDTTKKGLLSRIFS
ncbi:MAG: AAA family ATPase [Sedimenticola sp.]